MTPSPSDAPYIHTFFFDALTFIFSPLLCLLLVVALQGTPVMSGQVAIFGFFLFQPFLFFSKMITQGHVAAVVLRSHLNRGIFERHRTKVILAPILLLLVMNIFYQAFVACALLMVFWVMYHYSLQHFGIARLYDAKGGNYSRAERGLDLYFCLVVTFFPMIIGSDDFLNLFSQPAWFDSAGLSALGNLLSQISAYLSQIKGAISLALLLSCAVYFGYYAWLISRRGKYSWQKLAFMFQLAAVYSLGWIYFQYQIGFLAVTILHSVQYYGLLSLSERRSLGDRLGILSTGTGILLAGILALAIGSSFGYFSVTHMNLPLTQKPSGMLPVFSFSVVVMVNLVHFWFDGFIWAGKSSAAATVKR